jgi:hypothetical protein
MKTKQILHSPSSDVLSHLSTRISSFRLNTLIEWILDLVMPMVWEKLSSPIPERALRFDKSYQYPDYLPTQDMFWRVDTTIRRRNGAKNLFKVFLSEPRYFYTGGATMFFLHGSSIAPGSTQLPAGEWMVEMTYLNGIVYVHITPSISGTLADASRPTIYAANFSANNATQKSVTVVFSKAVWGSKDGFGPQILPSSVEIWNSEGITGTVTGVTKDNFDLDPLTGGETSIRVHVTLNAELVTGKTFELRFKENTVFDSEGNALFPGESTGLLTTTAY